MAEEELDLSTSEGKAAAAQQAIKDSATLDDLFEMLAGKSRARRQQAASTIALVSQSKPELLKKSADKLAQAVYNPESQTRWECLNALCNLCLVKAKFGKAVIEAAEEALFTEDSGIVREAAFRFFCLYGGKEPAASEVAWPFLDEAIQCHHGNPEFPDMLVSLAEFAEANISLETSRALAKRMEFDAETAKGTLKMRATQIIESNKTREASGA